MNINVLLLQEIVCPSQLYDEVIEVEERLVLQQENCQMQMSCPVVTGTTKEKVQFVFCRTVISYHV